MRFLALAAGAAALFLTGFAGAAATAPAAVTIGNFAFGPASLTVARGTRVVWTNTDEEPHTVTSANPQMKFKSAGLDTNESFAVTFDKPGTYHYFCSIHPQMEGVVRVQ